MQKNVCWHQHKIFSVTLFVNLLCVKSFYIHYSLHSLKLVIIIIVGIVTRRSISEQFLKDGFNNREKHSIIHEISVYLMENKENIMGLRTESVIQNTVRDFVYKWAQRWTRSGYSWTKFINKNAPWLDESFFNKNEDNDDEVIENLPGPSKRKCFADLSKSQKNRNTKG